VAATGAAERGASGDDTLGTHFFAAALLTWADAPLIDWW
jgi:hypothetical protein